MKQRSDFLVIGSGIAGLTAALKLSELGTVSVVTKKETVESNTNYAQGGIAAVMGELDSFESHVQDTLRAGAGLCDEAIVRMAVADGPERIRELIRLGVRFSAKERRLDLGLEGGHSQRRILHSGDLTGREIERALVAALRARRRIRVFENHVSVDLILARPDLKVPPARNRVLGAYVLDNETGKVRTFAAKVTLLATGGAGKVYLYTSNPDIATGDGMAMAYRAGAPLADLEFVQFHPTCLYDPGGLPSSNGRAEEGRRFLLTEALRGEGGVLRRRDGSRIMAGVHPLKDLAPRDVVARAIDAEMKRTGAECVFLDMSARSAGYLRRRFPNIWRHLRALGLDMSKTPVPVVPAAHFFCGGVRTDADGATALPGLFAVGEVANTGLHGANRLASNSLLEACVFAHRAYLRIRGHWQDIRRERLPKAPRWNVGGAVPSDEAVLVGQDWDEVRRLMWNYVGIVRSDARLGRALKRLRVIRREVSDYYRRFLLTRDLIELRNIALLGELLVLSALSRRESRGLHYTLDRPGPSASERKHTLVRRRSAGSLDCALWKA